MKTFNMGILDKPPSFGDTTLRKPSRVHYWNRQALDVSLQASTPSHALLHQSIGNARFSKQNLPPASRCVGLEKSVECSLLQCLMFFFRQFSCFQYVSLIRNPCNSSIFAEYEAIFINLDRNSIFSRRYFTLQLTLQIKDIELMIYKNDDECFSCKGFLDRLLVT